MCQDDLLAVSVGLQLKPDITIELISISESKAICHNIYKKKRIRTQIAQGQGNKLECHDKMPLLCVGVRARACVCLIAYVFKRFPIKP